MYSYKILRFQYPSLFYRIFLPLPFAVIIFYHIVNTFFQRKILPNILSHDQKKNHLLQRQGHVCQSVIQRAKIQNVVVVELKRNEKVTLLLFMSYIGWCHGYVICPIVIKRVMMQGEPPRLFWPCQNVSIHWRQYILCW